ncbi:heme NO-binding domain-containing protein [Natronorubrum texcoconense]|uniref:Predicted hydrocarbon binding protein, contains 4VR domain n=1 Tax=Natronorubrum texcoconense TaxID=1095776 RepID=A0A1G9GUH6_9EURY|nr:heme NO-binding domain-containing protein [Natronorubrum texcoconense]SDL04327.1 Predicted hydrocarbon binding protein, contains 4VR domain [Natronorubrum texcoconense]
MHGIVHKTLKEYVVDRTDEETWETILGRADLEPALYLPVSTYDDHEIDAILSTLASMATQNRRQIERDFGRTLAPELLSTFNAHVREDDLFDLLERLETIVNDVDAATDDTALPSVSGTRDGDGSVRVTYRTHREPTYCGLAHGILEGITRSFDADATVTEQRCVDDGEGACVFLVERP